MAALILIAMIAIGAANLIRVERSDGGESKAVGGQATVFVQPDGPLTLEVAFVTADARAREWTDAPVLIFASLQADWPLDPQEPGPAVLSPGGWARFAFTGAGDDRVLSVVIERYSGEIVTAESQPWDASQTETLPVSDISITSEAAVVIAESGYGQAWRLQCPIQRHETDVTLLLGERTVVPGSDPVEASPASTPLVSGTREGSPVATIGTPTATLPTVIPVEDAETPATSDTTGPRWLVTYRDGTQPGLNSVAIEIDAETGQVLFIDDQSQGCSNLAG